MNIVCRSPIIPGYQIREQLYAGSRTKVYRALREQDSLAVVIKLLNSEYPSFNELLQFRNQYAIAKNLNIPGIIHPLSLETFGNGYILVMEDKGEISLDEYIKTYRLSLVEFLSLGIQLADILYNLYQNKVIHKDIKPANILIDPEGKQIQLIDFSIASLLTKETQEIKSPNLLEGTLAYISPEQTGRMNRGIDYRSDFYSLGITLFEILTGELPFISSEPMELVHCHIAKIPPVLSHRKLLVAGKEEISPVISDIIMKLMAKNAEDRYQSALGLKHDLETCLYQLKNSGEIRYFQIGQRDVCDRFLIPEKLYGREVEVRELLDAFKRVTNGSSEMILVAGFSGVGKTAVVNEVHKPMTRQRGYFIQGKFDQFNRNIPFSAFVQALRDLMGQLLSESDSQQLKWCTQILEAVGENGQVLIEVIPELEALIGKQPPASELSGTAAHNRFNLLFQNFIAVFAKADHPLVIFLDDLQWSDAASMESIELLMSNSHLLLLGAYRDNEVSSVHPLMSLLEKLKRAEVVVNTITLQPLSLDDTSCLVVDILTCSTPCTDRSALARSRPLTEFIFRKTQGNPFFTTQLLKALYQDGNIKFNRDDRYWEWDLTQINALFLTDDVVEFIAAQLQKLSPETQKVLKLAACIGNHFDLETLSIVYKKSYYQTAKNLWESLQEGLVIPQGEIYKFFSDEYFIFDREKYVNQERSGKTFYKFLHDRVQQAVYTLIEDNQKKSVHLNIGRLLLSNLQYKSQEERLFEIVDHLNLGHELITDERDIIELIKLNIHAGEKAKKSTAYVAFRDYLRIAQEYIGKSGWDDKYELSFKIHRSLAEAEQLNGNFQESENLILLSLEKAQKNLEKADLYNLFIIQYTMMGQGMMAVNIGRKSLNLFAINLPSTENVEKSLHNSFQNITSKIRDISFQSWLDLPESNIPQQRMCLQLLNSLLVPSYISQQEKLHFWLGTKIVELSYQYGTVPASAYGFIVYGMFLGTALANYKLGYDFGLLGLKLSRKYNKLDDITQACYIFGNNVYTWNQPLQGSEKIFDEGIQAGLASGNFLFLGYILIYKLLNPFYQGKNLEEIISSLPECLLFVQKNNHQVGEDSILALNMIIMNLLGYTSSLESFDIDDCSEQKYLEKCHNHQSTYALCHYYILKSMLLYLYDRVTESLYYCEETKKIIEVLAAKYQVAVHIFYYSLNIISLYSKASKSQQEEYWHKLSENQEKMKLWAINCPENFQHKFLLLEAEIARIIGKKIKAVNLYDRAIAKAKENKYLQEEALANELAAKFYLSWGKDKVAAVYMQEAYYCYSRWGAKAKVDHLEQQYPYLLATILKTNKLNIKK